MLLLLLLVVAVVVGAIARVLVLPLLLPVMPLITVAWLRLTPCFSLAPPCPPLARVLFFRPSSPLAAASSSTPLSLWPQHCAASGPLLPSSSRWSGLQRLRASGRLPQLPQLPLLLALVRLEEVPQLWRQLYSRRTHLSALCHQRCARVPLPPPPLRSQ